MALRVFGYGSLIWRPGFAYAARTPGVAPGWARRFWQGSTDHRGVPGAPGRVVTLVPDASARCEGVVYEVAPEVAPAVLAQLDHRERGGYERLSLRVLPRGGGPAIEEVLAWVATPANENWLGEASDEAIAAQVRVAAGPSGANVDYALRLRDALRELGARDPHVEAVAALLR